jgi:NAD(P)-dependent dehydrogenase (short-subunit alcohol dehydrogenase family)
MPSTDIADTTAVVTGASRGFGRGIATALSRAGAQVVGVARDHYDQDAYLLTAAGLRPLT